MSPTGLLHATKGKGAKPTWESICMGSLGLYSFYMKGLGSVGFSVVQPMLIRRASEAKWALAAAANFCNNYQKSNKNHAIFSNICLSWSPPY